MRSLKREPKIFMFPASGVVLTAPAIRAFVGSEDVVAVIVAPTFPSPLPPPGKVGLVGVFASSDVVVVVVVTPAFAALGPPPGTVSLTGVLAGSVVVLAFAVAPTFASLVAPPRRNAFLGSDVVVGALAFASLLPPPGTNGLAGAGLGELGFLGGGGRKGVVEDVSLAVGPRFVPFSSEKFLLHRAISDPDCGLVVAQRGRRHAIACILVAMRPAARAPVAFCCPTRQAVKSLRTWLWTQGLDSRALLRCTRSANLRELGAGQCGAKFKRGVEPRAEHEGE